MRADTGKFSSQRNLEGFTAEKYVFCSRKSQKYPNRRIKWFSWKDNTLRLGSTHVLNLSSSIPKTKSACNGYLSCRQGIRVYLLTKASLLKVSYIRTRYALNYRNPISRGSWLAHLTVSAITLVFSIEASREVVTATSVSIAEQCQNTLAGVETPLSSVPDVDFNCTLDCP